MVKSRGVGILAGAAILAMQCRESVSVEGLPLLDPSGKQNIAFARLIPYQQFDIFIVSENGLGLLNLTNDPSNDADPRWSPDGKLLAFVSNRSGVPNIYTITLTGTNVRNVSQIERGATEPDWSPDGRKIAFQGETLTDIDIYTVDLVDGSKRNLTNGQGFNLYPHYSPTGNRIAFVSDRTGKYGLFIMNADGTDPVRLADITGFDQTFTLSWSPDGSKILYNLNTTGTRDILTINVDGSGNQNLTNHPADDVGGDWSRDGRYIVFQSNRSGKFAVYRMDPTGDNLAKITLGADEMYPSFSPNGQRVAFLSARRGAFEIWTVDPGGFEERLVTPTLVSDRTPRWRPGH